MIHPDGFPALPCASPAPGRDWFPTTHWSVVVTAGEVASPNARAALEKLCHTYWYPLYAFVRRRGYSPEDAQDLTQSFFERLLERDLLSGLRPAGARFRSFLLHALKNLLASDWTRSHARKRGGTHTFLSWDELDAEERYALEPADPQTAEALFSRRWATAVLQQALSQLRQEYQEAGKQQMFEQLAAFLTNSGPRAPYAQLSIELGVSEAALKMIIHRLRRRFGELLRHEVAQTVATAAEIDEELRHLRSMLAQG